MSLKPEKFTKNRRLIRIAVVLTIVAGGYIYNNYLNHIPGGSTTNTTAQYSRQNFALTQAIAAQQSDVQVEASGIVIKILRDDTQGSRHQRFLVELDSGDVILIAHNIDLAPRVGDLNEGEEIAFFGEYEWNSKGGVVHWTHHDPKNWHPSGWLKFRGQTYQ